ncbi:MAG: Gfo/Idh/MocA family oxidoreductase [Gemmataceae bacterium]
MSDTSLNRRQLLQGSASAVLAAGALSGIAHSAGSDTIKIGMIGCGGRCTGAASDAMNADPGVKLVAMCDLFRDRVESSHRTLKAEKPGQVDVPPERFFVGLDGYRKVIDAADVVLIACAAKFHPLYLKTAVEAGKHVFVEKPHAIDPAGIKVVAEACALARQKNVGVLSGLHSRFDPSIKETIQRVLDGQIGEIVSIEENFIRGPYGNVHRPKGLSEMEVQYGNQYRFSWLCGDDVTQSLVHNLDRATWALRETPPVKCHGLGGRSSSFNLLGDVFDHHSVVYHYASGVRLYAFCRTQFHCYQEDSSIILGARGIAYPKAGRIDGPNRWRYKGERVSPYLREHQEFFRSIRAGKPLNCGDYMARSTLVAIMGQLSCYSGQEVTWEQASRSDFCFAPRPEECRWDMTPPVKPDANGVYPVAVPGVTKTV